MLRMVYAPYVQAFIKGDDGVVDISPYIVRGRVNRKINQVSTAQLTLRNPMQGQTGRLLFTAPLGDTSGRGARFHPQDPIIVVMQRLQDHPVQVFTGYVDKSPYIQPYPGLCTIEASCTLKRLLYTQWDAALPFVRWFLGQYGWTMESESGITNVSAARTKLTAERGQIQSQFTDGSIGALLFAVMTNFAAWDASNIFIEGLPPQIKDIVTNLYDQISKEAQQGNDLIKSFVARVLSTAPQGTATTSASGGASASGGSGVASGPIQGADKVVPVIVASAQRWNVPPELLVAIGIVENNLQPTSCTSGAYAGTFQVQWQGGGSGRNGPPYSHGPWSTHVPTCAEANDVGLASNACAADAAGLKAAYGNGTDDTTMWNWAIHVQGVTGNLGGQSPAYQTAGGFSPFLAQARTLIGQFGTSAALAPGTSSGSNPLTIRHAVRASVAQSTAPAAGAFAPAFTPNVRAGGRSPGGKTGNSTPSAQAASQPVSAPSAMSMPLPSADYGPARQASDIKLIVLHDTEGANTPGSTADLTNLFAAFGAVYRFPDGHTELTSAHMGVNGDGVLARYVDDLQVAHHVSNYNPQSLGIEQVGFASQTSWPKAQLDATASQVAYWASQYGIPIQFSTTHGVCQHKDLGASGGGHDDCGPNYPFNDVLTKAAQLAGSTTPTSAATTTSTTATGPGDVAAAFATMLNLPSTFALAEALAFTGKRSFMADQPIFPFVEQLCQASLRNFMSMPNGNFFAFFPDYFGLFGRKYYWELNDLEIIDGRIDLSDDSLQTHVAVAGDVTQYNGQIDFVDLLFTSGIFDIFDAFATQYIEGPDSLLTVTQPTDKKSRNEAAAKSKDSGLAFLQRYGARPNVLQMPMIRSPFFELFLAFQTFMVSWSKQFQTTFQVTFMPELFPGGLIALPEHHLQIYVEEVLHEFDYESGFTTTINVSSPSKLDDDSRPTVRQGLARPAVLSAKKKSK